MAEMAVRAFLLCILTITSSSGGIQGLRLSKQYSMVFTDSFTNKIGDAAAASADQSDGEAYTADRSTWNSLRQHNQDSDILNRQSFPKDFLFGAASASYQYEGASTEGGRGPSIWDTYTQKHPERIKDGSNGAIAVDSYHRYKEDVSMVKEIGFDAYRFSISWSRLLTRGHFEGEVNQEGIKYYNNLIDELLSKGLQPFVTLFHWDLPQSLEDQYGGFLSPRIAKDFASYAEVCFKEFGDRVKHWITLNEPYMFAVNGYGKGQFAPGRCSRWLPYNCSDGDSSTEPYTVAHHQLLAHASAVKLYKEKYQMTQKGQIGIALSCKWALPLSQSSDDSEAASRALAFEVGWFMEPLNFGSYPADMVAIVGERLPKFSGRQSTMLKGSFDFIGINYYTARYVAKMACKRDNQTVLDDSCVSFYAQRNGVSIGPQAASEWLYIYPRGIQDALLYIKNKFQNPVIYITENGMDDINDGTISLDDELRIHYYNQHLLYTRNAIQAGVNIKGYFAWSLLDNFQWMDGYTKRFGIVFVDFKDNQLKRYPKSSAKWFQKLLLYKNNVEFL